jgi:K319-like protein
MATAIVAIIATHMMFSHHALAQVFPFPPPPFQSPLTQLFKNQGQCIDFAIHNPGNTLGATKQACMLAFQNKFAGNKQQPIANAGPNQIVNQGAIVTLDGTRSYDPNGGTIVAYSWVQTAGIPISLTGAGTATPTFVAPSVAADTILAFSLVVTNNNGATSNNPAIVYITVR